MNADKGLVMTALHLLSRSSEVVGPVDVRHRPRRERCWPQSAVVAERTGSLAALHGRSVLVLADVENLSHGAADLGCTLCYRTLACLITASAARVQLHAFFSRERGDDRIQVTLSRSGWCSHPRDIETATTVRGRERFANSDNSLAFGAGLLATQGAFDLVVIGTGDGALGCDVGAAIRRHRRRDVVILTLSLAGSTSHRLNASTNDNLDGNIEIGRDCMSPVPLPAPGSTVHRMGPRSGTLGGSARMGGQ